MPTTSLRLAQRTADAIERIAHARNMTRSQVIREAIDTYIEAERRCATPDRLGLLEKLVTYKGSGRGDLARNSETYLRKLFDAQRRRRTR